MLVSNILVGPGAISFLPWNPLALLTGTRLWLAGASPGPLGVARLGREGCLRFITWPCSDPGHAGPHDDPHRSLKPELRQLD